MWINLSKPIVIAHRGDSAHAPENTLAAFKMAMDRGAQAIEFDVKLSVDKQVVVIHDQTVDRTTNGHGDVRELHLDELQRLEAGVRFGDKFPSERIPSLEEVFRSIGLGIHMNIELTNYATPQDGLVEEVAKLVTKFHVESQILFSSFFLKNLKIAKRLLPSVPCGLLTWAGLVGIPARNWGWKLGMDALHPYHSDVTKKLVSNVHGAGKRIHVWTVNDRADMERLIELKVDGIFTDDPKMLCELLGRET
jgi:glycerophosphoryl diester phosphodiesterase